MLGPFSPRVRRTLVVLPFAIYACLCMSVWLESEWRPGPDEGMYVLTAQSFARGDGLTYLDRAIWWTPGLPWLLSWTMPRGEFVPLAANALMMAFAAAMPVAIALGLRRRHGTGLAVAAALLTATTPLWVARFNFVATEFPFMVALFLGFAAADHASKAGPRAQFWAVAGALSLTAAVMVRSVALVAIPGVLLAGWLRSPPERRWAGLLPGALASVLSLPWILYSSALNKQLGRWDQALVYDYSTAVLRVDPNDPTSGLLGPLEWIERISSNLVEIAVILGTAITGTEAHAGLVGGLFLVLATAGFVLTLRRGAGSADWFALAYGGVTIAYFTSTARLTAPAAPFVFLYTLVSIGALWRAVNRSGSAGSGAQATETGREAWAALATLLLAANLLQLPRALHPETSPLGETHVGRTWRTFRTVSTWVRENTDENAVLLCGPASIYGVLTQRRTYTHNYAALASLVERYGPDYVLVPRISVTRGGSEVEWLEERSIESWAVEPPGLPGRAVQIYRLPPSSSAPSSDPSPNARSSSGSSSLNMASISLR